MLDPGLNDFAPLGRSEKRSAFWYFTRTSIIFLVLFSVIDGAFFQAEMAATGGTLPIHPSWITWLTVTLITTILVNGGIKKNPLITGSILLLVYTLFEGIYFSVALNFDFRETHAALIYVIPICLMALAASSQISLKDRDAFVPLCLFVIPCLIVSGAQFATNKPVVYTESLDGYFRATTYLTGDLVRAFSLFSTGLQAGIFYCFTGALGFVLLCRKGSRLPGAVLFFCSALACYATLTRLMLVTFAFVTFASAFFVLRRSSRLLVWMPLVSVGVGILTIIQSLFIAGGYSRTDLANTSTLAIRFGEWAYYWSLFSAGTPMQILFGRGIAAWQPESILRPGNAATISIDNGYLLILLSTGVIGLAVVSFCLTRTWNLLFKKAMASRSTLGVGTVAFCSAFPLVCIVSDLPTTMLLLGALFLLSDSEQPAPAQPETMTPWSLKEELA